MSEYRWVFRPEPSRVSTFTDAITSNLTPQLCARAGERANLCRRLVSRRPRIGRPGEAPQGGRADVLVHMPETEPELWEGGGRRYRMEKVVGNGAFGVVWRAVEEGTSERVAIKKVRASHRPRCASLACRQGRAPRAARSPCVRGCLTPFPCGGCRWSSTGGTTTASWR